MWFRLPPRSFRLAPRSFRLPPRRAAVLVSALAAAVMLTAAGCAGHLTPLGPDSGPPRQQVRSPVVLQALHVQQAASPGGCPAGSGTLSGGSPGQCFGSTGAPVTITSAVVSPVNLVVITSPVPLSSPPPSGPAPSSPPTLGPGQTAKYGFVVAVPGAEVPALTAVVAAAENAGGLAISVSGQTWAISPKMPPHAQGELQVLLPSRKQALQLQHLLASYG